MVSGVMGGWIAIAVPILASCDFSELPRVTIWPGPISPGPGHPRGSANEANEKEATRRALEPKPRHMSAAHGRRPSPCPSPPSTPANDGVLYLAMDGIGDREQERLRATGV